MNIQDLIIERPASQSAAQRWTSHALTTFAWAMLFYGFFPIIGFIISRRMLPALPFEHNVTSMGAWGSLVPLLPWWALSAAVLIGALYIWATVQFFRFRNNRRSGQRALVSTAEMAAHCKHPEQDIKVWGAARRAVAHYDDKATMVSVGTRMDEPFREVPREDEPSAPTAPIAEPSSARVCSDLRQRQLQARAEQLRAELIDSWGRVESVEALMREVSDDRDGRENNRDVVLYASMKASHSELIASIKAKRKLLAQTRFLIEEYDEATLFFSEKKAA